MGTLAMYPKINKFWCHWLSFHLAHPNTLFAIYLLPSIRPVGPKPMACQLLSACGTSNESQFFFATILLYFAYFAR